MRIVRSGSGTGNGMTTIWLWLTVRHGKSPFVIGKPSINGPCSMAMLNNQRVDGKIDQNWSKYHINHFALRTTRISSRNCWFKVRSSISSYVNGKTNLPTRVTPLHQSKSTTVLVTILGSNKIGWRSWSYSSYFDVKTLVPGLYTQINPIGLSCLCGLYGYIDLVNIYYMNYMVPVPYWP